ncbi:tRNA (guanine-N(7)-)-methyltransferase [Fusarium oxysporum f. sp. albedinis]|nr:tRNA (guanine-N(7)-)-methyltransferase [Fusarium oxysporum f. sp. albedinis]
MYSSTDLIEKFINGVSREYKLSINFAERHPIGVWKVGLYRRLETSYTSTSDTVGNEFWPYRGQARSKIMQPLLSRS